MSQFLDRWNDSVESKVSPKTRERYAELLRLHVVPHVGIKPIQKLTAADLDRLYSKLLRDSGLAPRTVGHVHRMLHIALGVALKWGIVARNIADAAHRKAQQETRLQFGIGRLPDDALVISTFDGKPYSPDALTQRWRRALVRLKLPKVTLCIPCATRTLRH